MLRRHPARPWSVWPIIGADGRRARAIGPAGSRVRAQTHAMWTKGDLTRAKGAVRGKVR